jgi:hypothetical protein
MKEFVVRFKNSPDIRLRGYFAIVNEINKGIEMCWKQHESAFNRLDYGSDEESEFQAFQHEIEVLEHGIRVQRVPKREKDDICAWEGAQGF